MKLSLIRSDEGLTLETSAFRISVRWPIYIINSVDKTKIFVYYFPMAMQHHRFFRNYPLLSSGWSIKPLTEHEKARYIHKLYTKLLVLKPGKHLLQALNHHHSIFVPSQSFPLSVFPGNFLYHPRPLLQT